MTLYAILPKIIDDDYSSVLNRPMKVSYCKIFVPQIILIILQTSFLTNITPPYPTQMCRLILLIPLTLKFKFKSISYFITSSGGEALESKGKQMFYLTSHSAHFSYVYMASD